MEECFSLLSLLFSLSSLEVKGGATDKVVWYLGANKQCVSNHNISNYSIPFTISTLIEEIIRINILFS